ncbi:uncharacterized protein EAF01_005792 [Botrytis porri]|uniref:Uncharacterized protein n=1 Tax=Botrytis porri TaxID=87229 RepID=A0A4Z1L5U3_9HELO|nr:uncharacterized protein EAF01_005792 [Botrytis porri]KAF7905271.1 hypothetical protein EAF01_005792 [Botrytis porri]TGO92169.1 hypothetical protein BPOR_0008g00090 [Botrytis porri]
MPTIFLATSLGALGAHEQIDDVDCPGPTWLLLVLSSVCVEANRLHYVGLGDLLLSLLKNDQIPTPNGTLIAVLELWGSLLCQYNYYRFNVAKFR